MIFLRLFAFFAIVGSVGCMGALSPTPLEDDDGTTGSISGTGATGSGANNNGIAAKLTMDGCVDPDLNLVSISVSLTLCDGTQASGKLSIAASDVKSGVTIAGVTGSFSGSFSNCSAEGEQSCITAGDFRAVDVTGIATKIISSASIAGVPGNVTLPAEADVVDSVQYGVAGTGNTGSYSVPGNCSSDGAQSCVVTGSYAAALTTGLADKVLSTASVAGVTGNVTLPDPNNVLSGSGTYGVGGTALTPTLSLPVAGNVLAGSGTFGNPSSAVTPSLTLPSAGNVLTGSGTYGNPSSLITPTLTLPAAGNVLAGSGLYGNPGAPVSPQMNDRGNWDMETAFPGSGYFASVSNVPIAAEICNTATFNGAAGEADCSGGSSFKDFMGAFTHRDKASTAPGTQVSIATELGTAVSTKPAGYREVPVIAKDDYGTPATASVNPVVRNSNSEWNAGTPRLVCGKAATTIANKITNCDTEHSAARPNWDLVSGDGRLMWEGAVHGNASEGSWTLVSVYHPTGADGDTCDASCTEVWRDERTGYLWSDQLSDGATTTFNWCHASGSNNNNITGNPYAEVDPSGYCDNATYQVQTSPTLPISLCAEDADFLDTPSFTNDGKGGMRLTGTNPPVRWKLPTVHDMSQALIANGGYYVLPNMGGNFWSSSVRSSLRVNAWGFLGNGGNIGSLGRSGGRAVRCVGRP